MVSFRFQYSPADRTTAIARGIMDMVPPPSISTSIYTLAQLEVILEKIQQFNLSPTEELTLIIEVVQSGEALRPDQRADLIIETTTRLSILTAEESNSTETQGEYITDLNLDSEAKSQTLADLQTINLLYFI